MRERSIAGRLIAEIHTVAGGLTVDELLLVRAWLVSTWPGSHPSAAAVQTDRWLESSMQASFDRALAVAGAPDQGPGLSTEAERRARILAGYLCHRIEGSWQFDGQRLTEGDLADAFAATMGLNERDTRWWHAALDFDPPPDRLHQGPAEDRNLIVSFLKDSCRRRAGAFVSFTELAAAYRTWCRTAGLLALEPAGLIGHLDALGHQCATEARDARRYRVLGLVVRGPDDPPRRPALAG